MAEYFVSEGNGDDGIAMAATDTGLVRLTIHDATEYFSVDKANEIRALLAIVIAAAEGGGNG